MSGALLFLAGVVAGAILVRMSSRLFASAAVGALPLPLPEDVLGSDTANHVAAALATDSTFEPLAQVLIERCAARVGLPAALVMREREGGVAFVTSVAGGLDPRMIDLEVPLDSPAGRAITEGIPVVGGQDEKVVGISRGDRRRAQGGGVAVPISQGGRSFGAVIAFGVPPTGPVEAVESLANEVRKFAPVIIPAYAAAAAARRAETDDLTQLANRRGLSGAIARSGRQDQAALVVLDLDHFKQINDTHGHPAGDAALRHVSRLLRDAVRPRDTAARIGGEEFALWLPGADLATGREVAERVRSSLESAPFRHAGGERPLTVSCGVAAFPNPIKSVDNLMASADAALYQAKRGGRNRVVATLDKAG